MCIISKIISDVSSTKILVAANLTTMEQLTVYSNTTRNTSDNNYMILPVPTFGSDTIRFINLDKVEDPFIKLFKFFQPRSYGRSYGSTGAKSFDLEGIKHYDVGSYDVYVCKTLGLVSNFDIDKEITSILHKTYANNFSYLLCKLKTGNGEHKHHPIAYVLKIENGNLYIPTKHLHRHQINEVIEDKEIEKWGHSIYIYNMSKNDDHDDIGFCKYNDSKDGTSSLYFKKFNFRPHINTLPCNMGSGDGGLPVLDFKGDPIRTVTKLSISGMFYNDDLVVRVV